jgi:hypothetical protein
MQPLRAVIPVLAAGLCCSCQTYDFQPVTPTTLAQTSKGVSVAFQAARPNMMLVVDRSGSMDSQICAQPSCPTRLESVKSAMGAFLSAHPTLARFGVVPFSQPTPANECAVASLADIPTVGVDIPSGDTDADLQAAAAAVSAKIQSLTADGTTPTAAALTPLTNYAPLLTSRPDFVLLLTDGLPNCNASNPNTCANPTACQCTRLSCAGQYCSTGCLDEGGAVAAIAALKQAGISTIVVGFGAEVAGASGIAFTVLNAMADAGGFGRPCTGDNDCPSGDACNTTSKQCVNTHFYQAQDGDQLGNALTAISGNIHGDPCTILLDVAPPAPDLLSVVVNGKPVLPDDPNTWRLEPGPQVHFLGSLCTSLQNATPQNPVQLDLRVIQML